MKVYRFPGAIILYASIGRLLLLWFFLEFSEDFDAVPGFPFEYQ